ncbi:MAG TPA: TetR/AcrR family transcriptional regulator [Acidimicrobiales bacterium]
MPTATSSGYTSQRDRILAAALDLIAAHGVEGMTMRQLAAACDLNIATLYHYVGSKSDLLGAIVAERRYDEGLRRVTLPVDPALPPRARFEQFFAALATQSLGELRIWRLLIGESLRDDEVALAEARRLSALLEGAVDRWLADLFPELTGDLAAAGSVVTGQLMALFLEALLVDADPDRLAARGAALALILFPEPT